MTEELKRCPFCGGKPQIKSHTYARVECTKCFIITRHYNSDDLAREEWNARAKDDAAKMANEKTDATLATLAGELSTQSFHGEHPEVALYWAAKIWNAALERAMAAAKSIADGDAENAAAISYVVFCKIRSLIDKGAAERDFLNG